MFIVGIIVGVIIGSFATLLLYSCIVVGKNAEENLYKENRRRK